MKRELLVRALVWGCVTSAAGLILVGKVTYETGWWAPVRIGVQGFVVGVAVVLVIDKLSGVMAPSRNTTRLILLGLGIPLTVGLAIFVGVQVEKSIRVKRNLDIIAREQAKADSPARIAALQELVKAEQSLEKINLSHKILRSADFGNANLDFANLGSADLREVNLGSADLHNAILIRADLRGAILRNADLFHAYLSGADLSDADLSGADLSGADLSGADLSGADLSSAILPSLFFAKGLTSLQLEGKEPPLLCDVTLPKTIEINPNRDCHKIIERLQKRYQNP